MLDCHAHKGCRQDCTKHFCRVYSGILHSTALQKCSNRKLPWPAAAPAKPAFNSHSIEIKNSLSTAHQNTTPLSCRNCTKINPWLTNRNAVQSCKHQTCELQHKPTSAMMQSRVMFAASCSVDAVSCTRFLHHACLHRFCCFTTQQLYQTSCSAGDRHAASHKRAATRTACSVAVCRHICTSAGVQQAVNI